MPLLSIVIPVYNAENYLGACLDSVLGQQFKDYELILVNDGSSDGSPEICDRYADRDVRIRVIHQVNHGQAGARNRGIEAATGRYVGFCDNDDILSPGIFSVLMEQAISNDVDVSACSYQVKEVSGQLTHNQHTGEQYHWDRHESMREFLCRERMDIYVWTKVYRREFLNIHRIRFERGRSDEDFLFNYRVFETASCTVFRDEALYTYSVREVSESRMLYRKNLKKYLRDTLYRTYWIESTTAYLFPDLLSLAKRQTIFYNIIMLGRMAEIGVQDCCRLWDYILRYQRQNRWQLIKERRYWGMSLPGVLLMIVLPSRLYYVYRRMVCKK